VNTMAYVPERGHLVYINFQPQAGHEQAGRRPAVVISPKTYNEKSGLMLACPITSKVKGYPFEVALPEGMEVSGVTLADQLKSLDWRARDVAFIGELPKDSISEILGKLKALLFY
jgi:mRNA interferase MazF